MKNLVQIIVLSSLAAAGSGCALFNAAKSGNMNAIANAGAADLAAAARLKEDSSAYAKAQCDPIRKAEVGWDEERAMGGVVALKMVNENGGLVIDGMTEKSPKLLAERVKASATDPSKKVTLPDSPKNDLTAYLSVVGKNLARYSARPDLPWTFAVIENDTLNAYSAPGGYVILTSGLMRKMTNEGQLAGVLAHEIGHVIHKHALTRYRTQKAQQCEITKSMAYLIDKGASVVPVGGKQLAEFAKYFDNFDLDKADGAFVVWFVDGVALILNGDGNPASDEYQADKTALELVSFAGYDASEYETFLAKIGGEIKSASTHPQTNDRVTKLKSLRTGELAPFATGTAKPDVAKPFAPIVKK